MIDPEQVKAAIERAEQNLAYSRMTPPHNGYVKIRPSDLEIFLHLARLATSPEMVAMRRIAKEIDSTRPNLHTGHGLAALEAVLTLGKKENADG